MFRSIFKWRIVDAGFKSSDCGPNPKLSKIPNLQIVG